MKPKIAISMGDPGGIGPEIVLKALFQISARRSAHFSLVGSGKILEATAKRLGLPISLAEAGFKLASGETIPIHEVATARVRYQVGRPSRSNGEIAGKAIEEAARLALSGEVDGIVTAPVSKESLALAGYGMIGHTEMLARMTGTSKYAMMLVRRKLRVIFATGHVTIGEVPQMLTIDDILERIKLAAKYIDLYMGIRKPRIGVACLNPHCGEGGFLGVEEKEVIEPAIRSARRKRIKVDGPVAADYLFSDAVWKNYDCILAMYHDQGMIALRSHGFDDVVNITLGIPIVRTSPGHGTAFDIAGKGIASERSMIAAMVECARIIKRLRNAG